MTAEKEVTLKQYKKDSTSSEFLELMKEDGDRDEIVINEFSDFNRVYNTDEEYDLIW